MHTKTVKDNGLGETNLWRKAPKTHQQTGGSDFSEPAGTIFGSPSVVPTSSIIAPSVVLSVTLTAPSVVLTSSLTTSGISTTGEELDAPATLGFWTHESPSMVRGSIYYS
uniref:Uncharacterized protein n=1 Tax=Solanum tuberosum TaxID=4113 RepID=M1DU37_SOLTU